MKQDLNQKKDPRDFPPGDHLNPADHYNISNELKPEDSAKLSSPQKLVYNFLVTGWYSSREISLRTGYFDTRSIIRRMKRKGITVLERWYRRQNGEKFKKFTIITPRPEPEKTDTDGPKSVGEIMDEHFSHLKKENSDGTSRE